MHCTRLAALFSDAYFIIGEVFFGVLYSLLGVLDRETGVVLGAMFTFFGVAIRLGDGDVFTVAVALDLKCYESY